MAPIRPYPSPQALGQPRIGTPAAPKINADQKFSSGIKAKPASSAQIAAKPNAVQPDRSQQGLTLQRLSTFAGLIVGALEAQSAPAQAPASPARSEPGEPRRYVRPARPGSAIDIKV